MITLDKIGKRICIIGCSNSGKSTLAAALSKKLNIPAYHLDQFAHLENTKWIRASDEVLIKKHDAILSEEAWIIDGNYSVCLNQRLNNATFVIWLDPNIFGSVLRYLFRSIKNNLNRPGRLVGAKNEFQFQLIKWIIFNYPKNRRRYKKILQSKPDVPVLHIRSMKELKKYDDAWSI